VYRGRLRRQVLDQMRGLDLDPVRERVVGNAFLRRAYAGRIGPWAAFTIQSDTARYVVH